MKLPISKRLLLCAGLVPLGARVADVGCDHGYLGIHLLQNGIAQYVLATDLNAMPLDAARRNAEKFGVADKMRFACASGLDAATPAEVDTVVCCGMGGDLIRTILENAPWVRNEKYTLILQPQHGAPEFRKWLFEEGFELEEEHPVEDDDRMYFAMKLRYTGLKTAATPGQLFVTPQMLRSNSPDLPLYIDYVVSSILRAICGMEMAVKEDARLPFFRNALHEIAEMRDQV